MQDIRNALEIKRPAAQSSLVYIFIVISKTHGN